MITEYIDEIHYIRGKENIVADCLSRPNICSVQVDIFDLKSIADAQVTDDEIKLYVDKLKSFKLPNDKNIYCDTTTFVPRPFVPGKLRDVVFKELHGISHPGVKSSVRLIKSRYFWPNIDCYIKDKVRNCMTCQESKINRHTKSPLKTFELPVSSRFQYVHMDIVGPLPSAIQTDSVNQSLNYRYLLTVIDRATRWIEAIPLVDITATTVARAFLDGWISRFGVPLFLCTDQGKQFESELFKKLSSVIGFTRLRTAAYRPQTNGFIERIHRTLKTILKTKKCHWLESLSVALLGLRVQPNVDSGISPFTYVTGSNMLVPTIIVDPVEKDNCDNLVKILSEQMEGIDFSQIALGSNHATENSYIPRDLFSCSHVWVRIDRILKPLEAPYEGPFLVIKRGDKTFTLEKPSGKHFVVSVDRLKPVYCSVSDTVEKHLVTDGNRNIVDNERNFDPTKDDKVDENILNEDKLNSNDKIDSDNVTNKIFTRSNRKVKFNTNPDYVYF